MMMTVYAPLIALEIGASGTNLGWNVAQARTRASKQVRGTEDLDAELAVTARSQDAPVSKEAPATF